MADVWVDSKLEDIVKVYSPVDSSNADDFEVRHVLCQLVVVEFDFCDPGVCLFDMDLSYFGYLAQDESHLA